MRPDGCSDPLGSVAAPGRARRAGLCRRARCHADGSGGCNADRRTRCGTDRRGRHAAGAGIERGYTRPACRAQSDRAARRPGSCRRGREDVGPARQASCTCRRGSQPAERQRAQLAPLARFRTSGGGLPLSTPVVVADVWPHALDHEGLLVHGMQARCRAPALPPLDATRVGLAVATIVELAPDTLFHCTTPDQCKTLGIQSDPMPVSGRARRGTARIRACSARRVATRLADAAVIAGRRRARCTMRSRRSPPGAAPARRDARERMGVTAADRIAVCSYGKEPLSRRP